MSELLERTAFTAWLAGQKPKQQVGTAGKTYACPIACYLKRERGYRWVDVGVNMIRASVDDVQPAITADTALWAVAFITECDRGGWGKAVSASQALSILRAIPDEAQP